MKRILLILSFVVLVAGCERSDNERKALTQHSASHPEYITTMPDGRNLFRITVASDFADHDHYVYFFNTNDVSTVTVNYSVPAGKFRFNRTIVIDGVTYQSVNITNN